MDHSKNDAGNGRFLTSPQLPVEIIFGFESDGIKKIFTEHLNNFALGARINKPDIKPPLTNSHNKPVRPKPFTIYYLPLTDPNPPAPIPKRNLRYTHPPWVSQSVRRRRALIRSRAIRFHGSC